MTNSSVDHASSSAAAGRTMAFSKLISVIVPSHASCLDYESFQLQAMLNFTFAGLVLHMNGASRKLVAC